MSCVNLFFKEKGMENGEMEEREKRKKKEENQKRNGGMEDRRIGG